MSMDLQVIIIGVLVAALVVTSVWLNYWWRMAGEFKRAAEINRIQADVFYRKWHGQRIPHARRHG